MTRQEMIDDLRCRRGLLKPRGDSLVSRREGLDVDTLLATEIEDRYMRLLATAPPHLLPLSDLAQTVTRMLNADGSLSVYLPDEVQRVVTVLLPGWERPAEIITNPEHPRAALQGTPGVSGGACRPVAIVAGNELRLYTPVGSSTEISRLVCVVRPPLNTYTMHRLALAMMYRD